ncbi:hypothetical protein CRE_03016 [Caenorhabditis remanei]|uniref:Uncharacterized protein n=1 Tax=Caenorhabditis remanei TaxID=31234 RepID=E3LX84_CAERE|nr:hypothetical protein CRE_03016 [Caenorhabditis remanei]
MIKTRDIHKKSKKELDLAVKCHADTESKEYSYVDMKVMSMEKNDKICWTTRFPDGLILKSNHALITEKLRETLNPKYFILDQDDIKWFKSHQQSLGKGGVKQYECLTSLPELLNLRPLKKLYLRGFPLACNGSDVSYCNRVFADEVIQIIPILLKRQNRRLADSDTRLQNYCEKWNCGANKGRWFNSICTSDLKEALDDFDIDKMLVTIVPDPVYHSTAQEKLRGGNHPVVTFSSDGHPIMYASQAILSLFENFVFASNFEGGCSEEYKKELLKTMKKYENWVGINENVNFEHSLILQHMFISKSELYSDFSSLEDHRELFKTERDMNAFNDHQPDDRIPMQEYIEICKEFEFSTFCTQITKILSSRTKRNNQKDEIPYWLACTFYSVAWMEKFLEPSEINLKRLLWSGFKHYVPSSWHQEIDNSMEQIFKVRKPITSSVTPDELEQMKERMYQRIASTERRYRDVEFEPSEISIVTKESFQQMLRAGKLPSGPFQICVESDDEDEESNK